MELQEEYKAIRNTSNNIGVTDLIWNNIECLIILVATLNRLFQNCIILEDNTKCSSRTVVCGSPRFKTIFTNSHVQKRKYSLRYHRSLNGHAGYRLGRENQFSLLYTNIENTTSKIEIKFMGIGISKPWWNRQNMREAL